MWAQNEKKKNALAAKGLKDIFAKSEVAFLEIVHMKKKYKNVYFKYYISCEVCLLQWLFCQFISIESQKERIAMQSPNVIICLSSMSNTSCRTLYSTAD